MMNISTIKQTSVVALLTMMLGLSACSQPNPSNQTNAEKSNDTQTTATATEGKKIKIATEGAYKPFNFKNADGSLAGFDVDVAKAICAEIKADCQIIAQDWDGLIPGLAAKKYDAIIAGMSITEDRQQQVDFTSPYFKNTMFWLAAKDSSFNPEQVKGLKLGGQRSTTPGTYLQEKYSKDNEIKLYDTYDNAYLDLKSGRVDVVLSEKVTGLEWLKQNNDKFAFIGQEIDNNDNIAIAVRKGDELKAEFDKALATLQSNGELAKLEKLHFSE